MTTTGRPSGRRRMPGRPSIRSCHQTASTTRPPPSTTGRHSKRPSVMSRSALSRRKPCSSTCGRGFMAPLKGSSRPRPAMIQRRVSPSVATPRSVPSSSVTKTMRPPLSSMRRSASPTVSPGFMMISRTRSSTRRSSRRRGSPPRPARRRAAPRRSNTAGSARAARTSRPAPRAVQSRSGACSWSRPHTGRVSMPCSARIVMSSSRSRPNTAPSTSTEWNQQFDEVPS